MTHQDLLELGFRRCEDDFYVISFKLGTHKFGIRQLQGHLEDGEFILYSTHDASYTDKAELQKMLDVVGGEVEEWPSQ